MFFPFSSGVAGLVDLTKGGVQFCHFIGSIRLRIHVQACIASSSSPKASSRCDASCKRTAAVSPRAAPVLSPAD